MIMKNYTFDYAYRRASQYFYELAEKLKDTHEVVASCNGDFSKYLIPKGTVDQLSYYGKPKNSYRLSDHWNWYSSTYNCKNEGLVQCENCDLPRARARLEEGKATKPRKAICVAYYGDDHKYHTVLGEKFIWSRGKPEYVFVEPNSYKEV